MNSIKKTNNQNFPFEWVNIENLQESNAEKKEIYLIEHENICEDLILLFYSLFGSLKDNILIYNSSWWDFCLDTWNPNKEESDYGIESKSEESINYLKLLENAKIETGYSGSCKCMNWDTFLPIILRCIVNQQAPYSPIFYNEENDFLFYFHYSGSIGFYYYKKNEVVEQIIKTAQIEYNVVA